MRHSLPILALLVALAPIPAAATQQVPDEGPPRESGLVERTGRRLAQLDVTVSGPADRIADLTREDFELVVGGKFFEQFLVDRVCREPEGQALRTVEKIETTGEARQAVQGPRSTFLFYFDQPHLTMAGWNRAVQMARELIPTLIRDGNRGMIVSSGRELKTYSDVTGDPDALLAAMDRYEEDRPWDPFAQNEEQRIEEVLYALTVSNDAGLAAARRHQREERWRTGKALRRFSMVLGRLADVDPPKAVIYFADTMRSNAGEHYVSLFGQHLLTDNPDIAVMETDSFTAGNPFNRVLDEAGSHGIRIYPVQAEGLRALESDSHRRRVRDAENSLKGLALETGGQAFTGGYRVRNIISTIEQDLSCLYLISFDPAGLPLDSPLPVRVRVKRARVRAQVRGRIVLQSDGARATSRLLAAFGAPGAVADRGPIRSTLVPTGYADGRFDALLQVSVPGTPVSGAVWDLGASIISGGRLLDDTNGRVEVSGPGIPVVLEAELSFRPGPYSVVSVAHETTTDRIASREDRGNWPDPRDEPVSVLPVSIVQPAAAIFLRGGAERRSGALAVGDEDAVRTDRPTAFIGMVCWDKVQKAMLTVERSLAGETAADFAPMSVEPGSERCAYFRDLVAAGTMTPGGFVYRVRVLSRDQEVAALERQFSADEPGGAAASPASSPRTPAAPGRR